MAAPSELHSWLSLPTQTTTEAACDFWAVWQAADGLFPARMSRAFLHGMTGGALRSALASPLLSDLNGWLIPGLVVCGIEAELIPLAAEETEPSDVVSWLRASLRRHSAIPLFLLSPPASEIEATLADTTHIREQEPLWKKTAELPLPPADAVLERQALVVAVDTPDPRITLQDWEGNLQALSAAELMVAYSHGLRLNRAPLRQSRALHSRYALRQWAVYSCACPDRIISAERQDVSLRALAGEFWRTLAGEDRSASSNRLRRLAASYEIAACQEDLVTSTELLCALACASLLLPPEVENALLAPLHHSLTETERRELIYLCRAGTRDLKILAAHRLAYERDHADARATLEQLRYDADAWVRKIGNRQ